MILLDGGSGVRPVDTSDDIDRIDILLSHLHMDHVQGLPFFPPLLDPDREVHVWGPISTTRSLRERLSRYMSPPLFPVRIRDLNNVFFHDVVPGTFSLGPIEITADLITHPGSTLGYRLVEGDSTLAYLSDHEPAFGAHPFPQEPAWTSGFDLASGADVLIHDAQYDDDEYTTRVGWGHSSISQLAAFAEMTEVKRVVTFHHDPSHTDDELDVLHEHLDQMLVGASLVRGTAGLSVDV
jgi:ribonuclease BN (tRNA processing enzyme)